MTTAPLNPCFIITVLTRRSLHAHYQTLWSAAFDRSTPPKSSPPHHRSHRRRRSPRGTQLWSLAHRARRWADQERILHWLRPDHPSRLRTLYRRILVLPHNSTQLHSLRAHSRSARKGPSRAVLAIAPRRRGSHTHGSLTIALERSESSKSVR